MFAEIRTGAAGGGRQRLDMLLGLQRNALAEREADSARAAAAASDSFHRDADVDDMELFHRMRSQMTAERLRFTDDVTRALFRH